MKELAGVHLLFILFVALIMPVHASVTMEATIDQSIHVILNFENVTSPIYDEIKQTFNVTTLGDDLLNSPFLILGALIMVIIIAFIYRKIRK